MAFALALRRHQWVEGLHSFIIDTPMLFVLAGVILGCITGMIPRRIGDDREVTLSKKSERYSPTFGQPTMSNTGVIGHSITLI
jgi:hypothetical protein